jgi:hypothetical protein
MMRIARNSKSIMTIMKSSKFSTMAENTIKVTFVDQDVSTFSLSILIQYIIRYIIIILFIIYYVIIIIFIIRVIVLLYLH